MAVISVTASGSYPHVKGNFKDQFTNMTVYGSTYTSLSFTVQGTQDGTNYFNIPVIDAGTLLPVAAGTSLTPSNGTVAGWKIPSDGLAAVQVVVAGGIGGTANFFFNSFSTVAPGIVNTNTASSTVGGAVSANGKILTTLKAAGGIGYGTGAGGTVTQATNKSTGVTLNAPTGQITMNNAALAAGAEVAFTLTNSTIAATDVVCVSIASGGTSASYGLSVTATAAGSCEITISNLSSGSLGEALVLNYTVFKGVAA